MTVKELIEFLKDMPQDAEIHIEPLGGECVPGRNVSLIVSLLGGDSTWVVIAEGV